MPLLRASFRNKAISNAADGLEDLWIIRLVFEMFTETDDKVIDRSGVGVFLQVPDLFENGLSRDRSPFLFDEILQEFCFHEGEMDDLVAISEFEIFKIYIAAIYLCTGRYIGRF